MGTNATPLQCQPGIDGLGGCTLGAILDRVRRILPCFKVSIDGQRYAFQTSEMGRGNSSATPVPLAQNAKAIQRNLMDMDDAVAMGSLKTSVLSDQTTQGMLTLADSIEQRCALLEQRVLVRQFCRFLAEFGRENFGEICLALKTCYLRLSCEHGARSRRCGGALPLEQFRR
jgi:hypothetical protein